MIPIYVKKSAIYKEFGVDQNKRYFDLKQKKFISNIDSLYFSVYLKRETMEDGTNPFYQSMIKMMDVEKQKASKSFEPILPFHGTLLDDLSRHYLMHGFGFGRYSYDFHKPDKYSFFVMGYEMDTKTPQVVVQIKSEALWLYGVDKITREVYDDLTFFFSCFSLEVEEIVENRIDYAYHTNYIQDPSNYFRTDKLGEIQDSSFNRWNLQGSFEQGKAETDYFTLGRRKSNNVFFRVYNKTKEVIEQSYKQFFFQLWRAEGLISDYDLYCYEKAFLHPSNFAYKHLNVARLQFYLLHGQDDLIKNRIKKMIDLENDRLDHEAIFELAEYLTPPVTTILNIEFETKRKFYRTFDKANNELCVKSKNVPTAMLSLYKKLDNLDMFHNYLTCRTADNTGVIRFIRTGKCKETGQFYKDMKRKDVPINDFWQRLQMQKLNRKYFVESIDLVRSYAEDLNAGLLKSRISNGISTLALYNHLEKNENPMEEFETIKSIKETPFEQDVIDFMSLLNENDIERATKYKYKKISEMKNKVTSGNRLTVEKEYKLIDKDDGTIIDTIDYKNKKNLPPGEER